jgi:outer membrane protein OmpA-like peptidoglycan-associated protein/tetratricopeptide (TPR) repeat protein
MKKLYISLSLLAGLSLCAQNKDTETADKLYARYEYVDAADAYLKLIDKGKGDAYVYRQLADTYYNIFNTAEAAKWYARAVETPQEAETYYRYAQMLKAEGKYVESNAQMQQFAALAPSDQRAIIFKADPDYLPKLKSQHKLFDEKALAINSDKSEFGAVLTNDNLLYFTSARNEAKRKYGWNDEPFLDMYQAVYNPDGTFAPPTPVSELNTKFHDGPASVSADGKTLYFSSESFIEHKYEKDKFKKQALKRSQVYLFKATRNGDKWENITPVAFNGKDFSTGNPSLSKDGKTLYFASDRPGSLGSTDIWKVTVNEDGSYTEPENLGNRVNTEGNENFPSVTDQGKLYFSSDGRRGFGALDVFMVDTNTTDQAINVGLPVNSAKDDFAFTFNTEKNTGFFSSNRDGNDNIYQAIPVCGVDAIVTVRDAKTGAPLAGAKVAILDDKRNVIETRTSGDDGLVSYGIDCDRAYSIEASKEGYESGTFSIAKTHGGKAPIAADLQPIETIVKEDQITLNEIYFEFDKSNITREGAFELDKLVQVMNKYPEMVILARSHTDNRGSDAYNMALSDRRARSTVQYILSKGIKRERISGKGIGEAEPKVDCKADCTEEQHAQNRRSEFLIVK